MASNCLSIYGQYPRIKYNNFGYNTRYISSGVFKLRFRQSLRQAPSPLLISGLESLMRENSSKSWLANLGESIKNDVSLFLSSAAGKYSRLFRLATSAGKQNPEVAARTKTRQTRALDTMFFLLVIGFKMLPEPIFSSGLSYTTVMLILYRTGIASPAKNVYQTAASFL